MPDLSLLRCDFIAQGPIISPCQSIWIYSNEGMLITHFPSTQNHLPFSLVIGPFLYSIFIYCTVAVTHRHPAPSWLWPGWGSTSGPMVGASAPRPPTFGGATCECVFYPLLKLMKWTKTGLSWFTRRFERLCLFRDTDKVIFSWGEVLCLQVYASICRQNDGRSKTLYIIDGILDRLVFFHFLSRSVCDDNAKIKIVHLVICILGAFWRFAKSCHILRGAINNRGKVSIFPGFDQIVQDNMYCRGTAKTSVFCFSKLNTGSDWMGANATVYNMFSAISVI